MHPLVNPDNTCCFTGHRPSKISWLRDEECVRCAELRAKIYDVCDALYHSGIRHFISGMAMGCDTIFAEEVIKLREKYGDITLEAAIPCETQTRGWPEKYRRRYTDLVRSCDYETMVSREYTSYCMQKRNRYMVDNSSVLLAVYDGTPGGTKKTIDYAGKKGLEIIRITP